MTVARAREPCSVEAICCAAMGKFESRTHPARHATLLSGLISGDRRAEDPRRFCKGDVA